MLKTHIWFIFHLMLLFGSWAAPFLLRWPLVLLIYGLVLLQFKVIGRCIVNQEHGLDETDDNHTFYADIMERLGLKPNRRKVKAFVRSWKYAILIGVALIWQLGLGMKPILC